MQGLRGLPGGASLAKLLAEKRGVETLLTRRARELKKIVINGVEMFLEQAAHQFEVWTGESAPRTLMQRAAMEALSQSSR